MSQKCSITESIANKYNGKKLFLNNCQAEKSKTKPTSNSVATNFKNNSGESNAVDGIAGSSRGKTDQSAIKEKVGKRANSNKGHKKPLVLSSQRYNKILGNAFSEVQTQKVIEEQQKFKEYLKRGNEQLVANFKSNIQRTKDQKHEELREQTEKRNQEARAAAERTKENENQKRRERVARAHYIVEKLKPGVRELNSAAMQSEVLRVRNMQRKIKDDFQKTIKNFDCQKEKECSEQGIAVLGTEAERVEEKQKNAEKYKRELLQTINNNQLRKIEQRKQALREQRAAREAIDLEIKAQIERERAMMEKKKETLRMNAIEAMRIGEQRRLRENMVEEVENRLCCVYNTGKLELDQLRAEFNKNQIEEIVKRNEEKSAKVAQCLQMAKDAEMNRVRRDISRMQLKFTVEEQEKIRKEKAAKQARIEAHLREMEQQKRARERAEQQRKFDIAQRLKNEEVNCLMNEAEKQKQLCKIKNLNAYRLQQIEDKNCAERMTKVEECKFDKDRDQEHKFYFEYARNLMEHAQQKGRPLYPFVKAVQNYKKENLIDCERKVPKHLQSQVPIGSSQLQCNNNVQNTRIDIGDSNPNRQSILQNCLKINEMIAKDGLATRKQIAALCEPQCPYNCQYHNGMGDAINDKCPSKSTIKHRYSMMELKQLNQYDPKFAGTAAATVVPLNSN